jgi:hypothetical protein
LFTAGASYGGTAGSWASSYVNVACESYSWPAIMGPSNPNGASGWVLLLSLLFFLLVLKKKFYQVMEVVLSFSISVHYLHCMERYRYIYLFIMYFYLSFQVLVFSLQINTIILG